MPASRNMYEHTNTCSGLYTNWIALVLIAGTPHFMIAYGAGENRVSKHDLGTFHQL